MVTELKSIFLSASIPLPERDPRYHESADIIAIRDAVISLMDEILPRFRLIWGGHPSITPLVYHVIGHRGLGIQEYVTLYQSKYFEKIYPEDNNQFKNVIQTENTNDRESSLLLMRRAMFSSANFEAGIFIGGMDGVEKEFDLFREMHPKAKLFPIASTGAASALIYERMSIKNTRLKNDYAYSSLFRDLLSQ